MYRLFDRSGIEDGTIEEFHYSHSSKMDVDDEMEEESREMVDETRSTSKKRRLASPTSPTEYIKKLKFRKVMSNVSNDAIYQINEKSVLVKSGRTKILEDALVDPLMTTCTKCNAIISKSRMREHLSFWCDEATETTSEELILGGLFVS